jgi:importin subunit beta-1
MNLADQLGMYYEEEGDASQSGPLSPYYEGVVQALLRVTETCVLHLSYSYAYLNPVSSKQRRK